MLTDKQCEGLQPAPKPYRVSDARGLLIEVQPSGSRTWRQRYRVKIGDAIRQRMLSLGTYPAMSLRDARDAGALIRAKVKDGTDPVQSRKKEKLTRAQDIANTFGASFAALMRTKRLKYGAEHVRVCELAMQRHLLPHIADVPLRELSAPALLGILEDVFEKAPVVAQRLSYLVSETFRSGVRRGLCDNDPAHRLFEELPVPKKTPRPAIVDPAELGKLLRDLDRAPAPQTGLLCQLLAYLFVRPSELSAASWEEFDLDTGIWRIPAGRMKLRREHVVPLPRQTIVLLRKQKLQSGGSRWLFPQVNDSSKFIERSRAAALLVDLGYKGRHCAHGFRSSASTILRENLFMRDAVEASLAHRIGNDVEESYLRSRWLGYRRDMMQAYADFLDALKADKPVDEALLTLCGKRALLAA